MKLFIHDGSAFYSPSGSVALWSCDVVLIRNSRDGFTPRLSEVNFRICVSSFFLLFCVSTWLLEVLSHHSNEMSVTWACIPMYLHAEDPPRYVGGGIKQARIQHFQGFWTLFFWFSSSHKKFKLSYVIVLRYPHIFTQPLIYWAWQKANFFSL